MGPKSIEERPYSSERHLQREKPHEEGDRDLSEVPTSQGSPGSPDCQELREAGERPGTDSASAPPGGFNLPEL